MNEPLARTSPPQDGPHYWRSLDELAETPAFKEWAHREFPQGASEWTDPVSRRNFVRIMSASFLLAGLGLTGCRRPQEIIHPFSKMPEEYVHGVPQYFATSMPERNGAQPLLVKSLDGRPIKIEGNPKHPLALTGTDRYAQASILDLYDIDRSMRFLKGANQASREAALDFLSQFSKQTTASSGEGVCVLMSQSSSPSRARLQAEIAAKLPGIRWYSHEPVDFQVQREAASQAHQSSSTDSGLAPFYRLDRAKVVVSLDCDFLGSDGEGARLIRDFSRARKIETPEDKPNRLYAVETLMSITGANADHRLRLSAGEIGIVAMHLTATAISQSPNSGMAELIPMLTAVPLPQGVKPEWVKECAADLAANGSASVVMAGSRQPLAAHLLVNVLNHVLGAVGNTVELHPSFDSKAGSLGELAEALKAGQVKTLVICHANPAYTAPADLDWPAAQKKAGTVLHLGYREDETAALANWHFPSAHYLESWGDARTSDGTVVSVQPLIAPIFGGLTELEFLSRMAGLEQTNPYEIVRQTLRGLLKDGDFELEWSRFLQQGFLAGSAGKHVNAPLDLQRISERVKAYSSAASMAAASRLAPDHLEVVFHRDYSIDDGRYHNNGWLQEMADPITKLTWENVISVSPRTAKALGVAFENKERGEFLSPLVKVEVDGRSIEGPLWLQPGQADNTVGLALGYGQTRAGRIGAKSGYNAYAVRRSKSLHFTSGGRLTPAGRMHPLATAQDHWAMEGRPIVREANLDQFRKHPDFAHRMDLEPEGEKGAMYQHPHTKNPLMKGIHQWGLSLDLNACIGCSTCVMACQSENNIPIVGKDQVIRGREMHWIRVERYYSINPKDTDLGDPQVLNLPMFCQHCENAPCENVCPVNATVHDEEGLNMMVFNRCVGTRYCSNNCPYKVRRFNYFDFNQRPLDKLYQGPLTDKGMPDLIQMVKNPDVTVRMRGVMEKCSYCIQRIEGAKIAQKIKAGGTGDVRVPDGTITPACAQACPAEAIVFGDISDPNSRVSRLKKQTRDYSVLEFLNTKPRTTYLAKVRNPNPRMPDYCEQPLSLAEFSAKNGDPMADEHAEGSLKKGAE